MRNLWVLGDSCGREAKKTQEDFFLETVGYISEEMC